jgi:hypothetical protein
MSQGLAGVYHRAKMRDNYTSPRVGTLRTAPNAILIDEFIVREYIENTTVPPDLRLPAAPSPVSWSSTLLP